MAMTMGLWLPSHAQSYLAESAPKAKADKLPGVRDLLDALDVAALKMNWSEKEQRAASKTAGAATTAYDTAYGAYFAAAKSSEQKDLRLCRGESPGSKTSDRHGRQEVFA